MKLDFFINKKNKKEKERGFSLIETFIAITVLLIAITGPLVLITQSLSVAKFFKNKATAVYLAQEAFEYIRNIRDNNILKGEYWLSGLEPCLVGSQECKIDSPAEKIDSCDFSGCENLKYNDASHLYGYSSGSNSIFRRVVNIEEINLGKEIKVVVKVYWMEKITEKSFSAETFLLNWQ